VELLWGGGPLEKGNLLLGNLAEFFWGGRGWGALAEADLGAGRKLGLG
jgi:hypothetical protein